MTRLVSNVPLRLLVCLGLKVALLFLVTLSVALIVAVFFLDICLPTGTCEVSLCKTVKDMDAEGDGMVVVAMSRQ